MSTHSGDYQRTYGPILARSDIHQEKKHQSRGNKKAPDQVTLEKQYEEENIPTPLKTKELHIWDQPFSKLYTDDSGRSPILSRSGNEYIMIEYNCDSNKILQAPFVNRK